MATTFSAASQAGIRNNGRLGVALLIIATTQLMVVLDSNASQSTPARPQPGRALGALCSILAWADLPSAWLLEPGWLTAHDDPARSPR
jgi:hypothetical protein